MSQHIQNPAIFNTRGMFKTPSKNCSVIARTVYPGIFRHIQGHSALFIQVQTY